MCASFCRSCSQLHSPTFQVRVANNRHNVNSLHLLSMVRNHVTALIFVAASSVLNWSYENTKPCAVLVGEETQVVPASKTVVSETNLSTATKAKPAANSGGKERKRRQVAVEPSTTATSSSSSVTKHELLSTTIVHDSTPFLLPPLKPCMTWKTLPHL